MRLTLKNILRLPTQIVQNDLAADETNLVARESNNHKVSPSKRRDEESILPCNATSVSCCESFLA